MKRVYTLSHLSLLLLPILSTGSKHGRDPLLLRLGTAHGSGAIGCGRGLGLGGRLRGGGLRAIGVLGGDGSFAGDVARSPTVTGPRRRKAAGEDGRRPGYNGGVIIIFFDN